MAKRRLTEEEAAKIIAEIRAGLRRLAENYENPSQAMAEVLAALAQECRGLVVDE